MKSLILVILFGKFKVYLESNGKLQELSGDIESKCYSTVKFSGPIGITTVSNEIPYSKGNRTLDDISYSFGNIAIPKIDLGISLAKRLDKKIDSVYFISERFNKKNEDAFIKDVFKKELKRDIYKGTVGLLDVLFSIGVIYTKKTKKSIQFLSPICALTIKPDSKHNSIDEDFEVGIVFAENYSDPKLLDVFKNKFSKYLTLFDEKKNLMILRGMYLAGFYGYIYEHKEEDVVNIYQDRKITLPFKEIKSFIDEVHIPHYKNLFNKNDVVYSINIPGFKELFMDLNLADRFIFSEEDFVLYAKMLQDFNNDISIKAYRLKKSDFICVFGKSSYGRKSSEFFDKQTKFVFKAIKDNKKVSI